MSGKFRMAMKFPPQCEGERTRTPITDRLSVNARHRLHDLARSRYEGFPRCLRFENRERSFGEGEPSGRHRIQNHRPGNSAEDAVVGGTRHNLAIRRNDPGIG